MDGLKLLDSLAAATCCEHSVESVCIHIALCVHVRQQLLMCTDISSMAQVRPSRNALDRAVSHVTGVGLVGSKTAAKTMSAAHHAVFSYGS